MPSKPTYSDNLLLPKAICLYVWAAGVPQGLWYAIAFIWLLRQPWYWRERERGIAFKYEDAINLGGRVSFGGA